MRLNKINEWVAAICVWLVLSIPSVKLIYSSRLINVGAFFLLAGFVFYNFRMNASPERRILLVAWSMFSSLVLLLFFYGPFSYEASLDIIDYFYLVALVYLIIIVASYELLKRVGLLVFIWGLFIAFWQIFFGINTSREFGQHYLTVSMPLGAALAYAMRFFFSLGETVKRRVFFAAAIGVIFYALSLLLSRSAFIYNAIILMVFLAAYVFINKNTSLVYKLSSVALLVFVIGGAYAYFFDQIEFRQFDRMVMLFESTDSESRMTDKYLPAFSYIADRPFLGYGMGASKGLYDNYPHNIFLEIMSVGGVFLLLPFLLILLVFLKVVYLVLRKNLGNPHLVGGVAFSLFFFLQFNSSFALVNSYIAIGSMVILIIGFYDYSRNYKKE